MKTTLTMLLLLLAFNCAGIKYMPVEDADLPNSAVEIILNESGEWHELVINDWQDVVSTPKGKHKYRYQQGFNYTKKQGFIRTFEMNGQLVNEQYGVDYDGRMSKEEMLVAYEIFKSHPDIKQQLAHFKVPIMLQGGFNYAVDESDMPCSKGMRCVHVFAHTAIEPLVAHAVIRMTDRSVPYPQFNHHQNNKKN